MIIKNPTEFKLDVIISGVNYVVEPKGSLSGVPVSHAEYWFTELHPFIQVSGEETVKSVVAPVKASAPESKPAAKTATK